jgi:hypothetical protein
MLQKDMQGHREETVPSSLSESWVRQQSESGGRMSDCKVTKEK